MADLSSLIQQLRGIGVRNPPREEEEGSSTQRGAGVRKNRSFVPRVVHKKDQINEHAQEYGFRVSAELGMLWQLFARWSEGLSDTDRDLLAHMKRKYNQLDGFGKFLVEIAGKMEFQDRTRRATDMVVLKEYHNSCGPEGVFFLPGYLDRITDLDVWDPYEELKHQFWTHSEDVGRDNFLIVVPIVSNIKYNYGMLPGATASCSIDVDDQSRPYADLDYLQSFQQKSSGRAGSKAISALCTVCRQLGLYSFKLGAVDSAKGFYVRQKLMTTGLCSVLFMNHLKTDFADTDIYSRSEIYKKIQQYALELAGEAPQSFINYHNPLSSGFDDDALDQIIDGGEGDEYELRSQFERFQDTINDYLPEGTRGLTFWAVYPFTEYATYDWIIDLLNDEDEPKKPVVEISRNDQKSSLYLVNGNALCSHNNIEVPGALEVKAKALTWGYYDGDDVLVKVEVGVRKRPFPLRLKRDVYIYRIVVDETATPMMVKQVLDAIVRWLGTYAPQAVNLCMSHRKSIVRTDSKQYLLDYGFTLREEGNDEIYLPLPNPPMSMQ